MIQAGAYKTFHSALLSNTRHFLETGFTSKHENKNGKTELDRAWDRDNNKIGASASRAVEASGGWTSAI